MRDQRLSDRARLRARLRNTLLALLAASGAVACGMFGARQPDSQLGVAPLSGPGSVFTSAQPSVSHAVRDFFGIRPDPVQPIPFPHNVHVEKGLMCTDYCHETVTKGPRAGLPSVNTCMICHVAIATDRPLIQTITAYQQRGEELPWQRVYGYTAQAHVRFNHAPHIRAEIECATCHGNVAQQTVAERSVDLTMGFCVNCHKERNASNDCLTCHY